MSVTDVKEDWRHANAGFDPEDGQARRLFTVLFDEDDEPNLRPGLACFAAGIPRMYQWHPFTPWLWVSNVRAKALGPLLYEVEITYQLGKTDSWQGQENPLTSPLDEPPQRNWSFAVSEEVISFDIEGKPIENSAGMKPDPPITINMYDLVYMVTRNEEVFDAMLAASYIGTVNSDYFGPFGPGTVKCTEISADEKRIGTFIFYEVRYEFTLRRAGWMLIMFDTGMWEKTGVDDDGKPKLEMIKDSSEEGTVLSEPVNLDGNGHRLAEGAQAVPLTFKLYKEMPFSPLGL